MDYLISHPLYVVFIILNTWLVIKVIHDALSGDEDEDDDDDDGIDPKDPDLDLPPGVGLPENEKTLANY